MSDNDNDTLSWLKGASPESLRSALIDIAKAYSIKEDDIRNYVEGMPTVKLQEFAEALHMVFCKTQHDDIDLQPDCAFYAENVCENPWALKEHMKWMDKAKALCKEFDERPDTMLIQLQDAYKNVPRVSYLIGSFMAAILSETKEDHYKLSIIKILSREE